MAVSVQPEGGEVLCTTIGLATDTEALVSRQGEVVRVEYSRLSASRQRRVHLVIEHTADDPELVLELARLRPLDR